VPLPGLRVNTSPLGFDAFVPEDHHLVLSWAEALDEADYLALLDLPVPERGSPGPTDHEIREAFHVFAERFHPDVYPDAPDDVRDAAIAVFRRGAEAYRVLLDRELRERYYAVLADGSLRLAPDEIARATRGERRKATNAREAVKTAAAAAFAALADELIAAGDLKKARLQLQLATMKEPDNADLAELLHELEEKLQTRRP